MKRPSFRYLLPVLLLCCTTAWAQNDRIYRSYVTKDHGLWRCVIDSMRALPAPTMQEKELTLNYLYGFIAWSLSEKSYSKDAQKYLTLAYEYLDRYVGLYGESPRTQAYRSAFIAYDMKLHPMKVPFIGMKSVNLSKKSVSAANSDYFPYIQYGNVMNYLPASLGGSKDKAIEAYSKACRLMEANGAVKDNWMYLNALLTLADIYKSRKDYGTVEAYYQQVLQIEPNFDAVRNWLKSLPKT